MYWLQCVIANGYFTSTMRIDFPSLLLWSWLFEGVYKAWFHA